MRLVRRVEDFAIEELVAKTCVEAFDITVLPGATALDIGDLDADSGDPFLPRPRTLEQIPVDFTHSLHA